MSGFQLVCTTEPRCLCCAPDDEGYSCECRVPVAGARICMECDARLVVINIDTGQRIDVAPAVLD